MNIQQGGQEPLQTAGLQDLLQHGPVKGGAEVGKLLIEIASLISN